MVGVKPVVGNYGPHGPLSCRFSSIPNQTHLVHCPADLVPSLTKHTSTTYTKITGLELISAGQWNSRAKVAHPWSKLCRKMALQKQDWTPQVFYTFSFLWEHWSKQQTWESVPLLQETIFVYLCVRETFGRQCTQNTLKTQMYAVFFQAIPCITRRPLSLAS